MVIYSCLGCAEESKTVYCPSCEEKNASEVRALRESKLHDALGRMGIPKPYLDAQLDEFSREVNDYLWSENKPGVLLCGSPGVGKTHAACALLKEAALHKMINRFTQLKGSGWVHAGRFIRADMMLADIRRGFDTNNNGVLQEYANKEFLVLDDLGAEKASEWVGQTWHTFLDHRLNEGLWTVITTNHKGQALARKYGEYGEGIESRLRGLCQAFIVKGEDRRRA